MISLREFDPVMSAIRKIDNFERAIYLIRGQWVMLDADLAGIYQVTTRRLNEQLRRNRKRFPEDCPFQLTTGEFTNLKSQIATSSVKVAQASSLWGSRASRLAFTNTSAGGSPPAPQPRWLCHGLPNRKSSNG
jgi:hypothetical protein